MTRMRIHKLLAVALASLSLSALPVLSANAADSVENASASSALASVLVPTSAAWVAYQGSSFTVKSLEVSGEGVKLVLQGVSTGIETSATIAKEAASAASVGVGTSVRVVTESTGYALLASGILMAFVPNEIGRGLIYHARHGGLK